MKLIITLLPIIAILGCGNPPKRTFIEINTFELITENYYGDLECDYGQLSKKVGTRGARLTIFNQKGTVFMCKEQK